MPDEASDAAYEAGVLIEAHTCPDCGRTATRAAAQSVFSSAPNS